MLFPGDKDVSLNTLYILNSTLVSENFASDILYLEIKLMVHILALYQKYKEFI